MKTISFGLDQHLNQEVTTLCTCWRLERRDGRVFAFTSLDTDLEINGTVYESQSGFAQTAIASSSDLSVDNLDITGILDSDLITTQDLRNKLFDFATIYVFMTNWNAPVEDDMKMRRGTLGEVSVLQNGSFTAEVRGMNQTLSHNYIEAFSPECRADFCDARCKLSVADFQRRAVVLTSTSRAKFTTGALPEANHATSVGAYKNWRIVLQDVADALHGGFAEARFWDQAGNAISGGSASASSSDKHHGASKARDGLSETNWSTDKSSDSHPIEIEGSWWAIEFGSAVDVKEVELVATKNYLESPSAFRLEYSANGGDTWNLAKACSTVWTAGGQSAIWVIGSDTSDPINYPGDPSGVAAPFTGASTYTGGTVTWRSGQNAGRTMEIADYSAGSITLFEEMAFAIQPGDAFDIAQGCDKQFQTCKLYENVVNYRGEPDVPGQDEFLTYPDAS